MSALPIAFWCVLIGGLLPYLAVGLAKFTPGSGYDNSRPRQSEAAMGGFRARALAAHLNGFEAFPLFAAAVLMASHLGAGGGRLDRMAMAWVVLRLAYMAVYCAGLATLRSVLWAAAIAVTIAIATLPAWA